MMRHGHSLGLLHWETDRIHLMQAGKFDLTKEELVRMERGEYVVRHSQGSPKAPSVLEEARDAIFSLARRH
ncbi:Uncharacterised protein [uncultured archaeon]|nr:Uncharacterised protein [uncultured archaeon]